MKTFRSDLGADRNHLAILLLRIGLAAMMLVHGIPKMKKLFGDAPIQFVEVFGLTAPISLGLAVFSEVFCSILLGIGLFTRIASLPLIFTMLVAAFVIHGNDPFNDKEMSLHYLLGYLVLLITGPGKYSIDSMIQVRRKRR